MSERDYSPLSIACVRGLCDKIYEKRKFAGAEIEKMVKDFNDANNSNQIKKLIRVLGQDLVASTNPNVKIGALLGLSSAAVGLGKGSITYLPDLIHPIVACFSESESKVRYQAAEALFNVLKIARESSLPQFPAVFEALARLVGDPCPQVKQAAELLDKLLKDIVTESPSVDGRAIVTLLRARMYSRSGAARQFAAGWVSALDAVPRLQLLPLLPDLLDPMLAMLDDAHPEIRRMCEIQLGEFLRNIKEDPSRADFPAMINILIVRAQSPEELVQSTSVTWIKEFVALGGASMLPYTSGILLAILPCLAYTDENRKCIRETAVTVNFLLTKLVTADVKTCSFGAGDDQLPANKEGSKDQKEEDKKLESEGPTEDQSDCLKLDAVVAVLTNTIHHTALLTKVASLDWILHLYSTLPEEMSQQTEAVFGRAVSALTDASDDVVRRAAAVLAETCSPTRAGDLESNPYYYKFLRALLRLFATDENLMEDRGAFIIRQLCVLLSAEDVFVALARVSADESSPRACSRLADLLSSILLTAPELHAVRRELRLFRSPPSRALFISLYACWSHSPAALLALCFLTRNYEHCATLLQLFFVIENLNEIIALSVYPSAELEITVEFLTEIDKLIQLIESPIFAFMRLELLNAGPQGTALRGALAALLMLVPQGEAFCALQRRLRAAPPSHLDALLPPKPEQEPSDAPEPNVDFQELLEQFHKVQQLQREYKTLDRSRGKYLDKGYL